MRILLFYILFALLSQQTTFLETENLKTSKSEKIQKDSQVFSFSVSQILYYENQIRLADSLYKNYLPQYNFEEVKAAVMFFDSLRLTTDNGQQTTFLETENLKTSKSEKGQKIFQVFNFSDSQIQNDSQIQKNFSSFQFLRFSDSFLCAKAHYYHAVGLTERDDIVGACEHYFIALEIMKSETENLKTSKSEKRLKISQFFSFSDSQILNNPQDYEKLRFLSLIYTRLGELFLSENYCDLAISKYRKALKYKLLLGENKAVANTYKCLGNSYHLYDMPDSALYYYNKSLATNSELPNRLDVEKCIAQILFDRGEKDSAYIMIKNNLDKIENVNIIYSYYNILGDMYINDKEYDCAIYYLDKSMNSTISDIRVYSAIKLSSIYNIIGDNIKKAYYDNIVSKILIDYNNSNIETSKLQYIYDRYKERKSEKEKSISRMRTKVIAVSLSVLVFITFVITILILRKSKRKDKYIAIQTEKIEKLKTEINETRNNLDDLRFRSSSTEGRIKSLNAELKKKEDLIKKFTAEISNLRYRLERNHIEISNLNNYLQSEVCTRILKEIKELSENNMDTSELTTMSQKELVLLLNSANFHLNHFMNDIANKYSRLKKEDLYYLCLVIIGLNNSQISSLLGVTYTAVRKRKNKICKLLGLDIKENLYNHLLNLI